MKIVLPEHIGEITLGQYQKYHALDKTDIDYNHKKDVISIFCKVELSLIDKFPMADIDSFYDQIMKALGQDVPFQKTFKFKDIDFGFHPNLDQMTGAEFTDLSKYQNDVSEYHRVMAILFRPIIEKDKFGNYELVEYNGTSQWADKMKDLHFSIVNGCLFFFSSLANELENHIHKFMDKAQAREQKHQNTSSVGGGMLR